MSESEDFNPDAHACEECGCTLYAACASGCHWDQAFAAQRRAVCSNCTGAAAAVLPQLVRHGKVMTHLPVENDSEWPFLALAPWVSGQTAHVILEPGDMTRYELVLTMLTGYGLHVAMPRRRGGHQAAVVIDPDGWDIAEIEPLCRNRADEPANRWTVQVIDWWLRVFVGLPARVPAEITG